MNISHILEGWANHIKDEFNLLDEKTKELSAKRLLICDKCDVRSNRACDSSKQGVVVEDFYYEGELRNKGEIHKGCSCNLAAKTKCVTCQCPLGKWKNI